MMGSDVNGTKITWLIVNESPDGSMDYKGFPASKRGLNLVPFTFDPNGTKITWLIVNESPHESKDYTGNLTSVNKPWLLDKGIRKPNNL